MYCFSVWGVFASKTALYNNPDVTLPDPNAVLGCIETAMEIGDVGDVEENLSGPALRQTPEYAIFMELFAKTVLTKRGGMKNILETKRLSVFMPVTLEAFAVITYVNNYETWKASAAGTGRIAHRRFTSGNNNKWSKEGMDLFLAMVVLLKSQQKYSAEDEDEDEALAFFETNLQERWRTKAGKRRMEEREETHALTSQQSTCMGDWIGGGMILPV